MEFNAYTFGQYTRVYIHINFLKIIEFGMYTNPNYPIWPIRKSQSFLFGLYTNPIYSIWQVPSRTPAHSAGRSQQMLTQLRFC